MESEFNKRTLVAVEKQIELFKKAKIRDENSIIDLKKSQKELLEKQ